MSFDLLNTLLQSSTAHVPYSAERFGKIVNEIEEIDPGSVVKTDKVGGPTDAFPGFLKAWLESLAEDGGTYHPGETWRKYLAKFAADHPEAGDFLPGWVIQAVVDLEPQLKPNTLLTCWESLQVALAYVDRELQLASLAAGGEALSKDCVAELEGLYPTLEPEGEFDDFPTLQRKLKALFEKWSGAVSGQLPVVQELEFLRRFASQVIPLHSGGEQFWGNFIQLQLAKAVDGHFSAASRHVLTDVLAVLDEAGPRFECLANIKEEFPILLEQDDQMHQGFLDLLVVFMLLEVGGGPELRERFLGGLDRDAFTGEVGEVVDAFVAQKSKFVEWIRARYERLFVDWFEDALNYFAGLRAAAGEIAAVMEEVDESLQQIGDDLAVGMKGQNLPKRFAALYGELLGRALWSSAVSSDLLGAGRHYRRALVADMGLDYAEEVWRKHSRIQAALVNVVGERSGNARLEGALPLIRSVDKIATATRSSTQDVRVGRNALKRLDLDAAGISPAVAQLLVKRLVIDSQLHSGRAFVESTEAWFAGTVLDRMASVNGSAVEAAVGGLAGGLENPKGDEPVPPAIAKALGKFVEHLPDLTASAAVRRRAAEVGSAAGGDPVFANARTCVQAAKVLSPIARLGTEEFGRWWSRAVGSFVIGSRPEGELEGNLNNLYRALGASLTAAEAERAFEVIHDTYRELAGVSCSAASMGTNPSVVEGPAWRKLFGSAAALADGCAPSDEELDQGAVTFGDRELLVKQVGAFRRAFLLSGDVEASWQRVMPQVDAALDEHTTSDLALSFSEFAFELGDVIGGGRAALWLDILRAGAETVAQVGLGRKLGGVAEAAGKLFATRAAAQFPDALDGLDADAVAADMGFYFSALGSYLRSDSATLAYLNTTRYLVEMLAPKVAFAPSVWRLANRCLSEVLADELDLHEQFALALWTTRLDAISDGLPGTYALAREVFASTEYSFSARVEEERAIRVCVSAAAVAAISQGVSPVSPAAFVGRFVLGSDLPEFKNQKQIGALARLLKNSIEAEVPDGFDAALDEIVATFGRVEELAAGAQRVSGAAANVALHAGSPCAAGLWQRIAIARAGDGGDGDQLAADDAALAAAGVPVADGESRAAARALLEEQWAALAASSPAGRRLLQNALQGAVLALSGGVSPQVGAAATADGAAVLFGLSGLIGRIEGTTFLVQSGAGLAPNTPYGEGLAVFFRAFASRVVSIAAGTKVLNRAGEVAGESAGMVCGIAGTDLEEESSGRAALRAFYARLGCSIAHSGVAAPELLFGKARENHRRLDHKAVIATYAGAFDAVSKVVSGAESGRLHQAWVQVQFEELPLDGANWAAVFGGGAGEPPDFLGAALGACATLAEKGAADAVLKHGKGDKAALQAAVAQHLWTLVGHLRDHGDVEAAIAAVMPLIDEDLEGVDTAVMEGAYLSILDGLDGAVGPNGMAFWHAVLLLLNAAVGQVGLGRALHGNLDEIALGASEKFVDQFPDETGGADNRNAAIVEERHFQSVYLGALGSYLRHCPASPLALGFGRYMVETTVGYLERSKAGYQAVCRGQEEVMETYCDPAERAALALWMGFLQSSQGHYNTARPLAEAVFLSGEKRFAERQEEERQWRAVTSGIIAAAVAPDNAYVPGKAILQRLVLSADRLSQGDEAFWKNKGTELLGTFNELSSNKLPSGMTKRLAELPRAVAVFAGAREQPGHGLSYSFALLSHLPLSRALWTGSLLARTDVSAGLGAQGPGDLAISQSIGWDIPDDNGLLAKIRALSSVWGIGDQFEIAAAEEEEKGGFFGKKKKATDTVEDDTPENRAEASALLRSTAIRQMLGAGLDARVWLHLSRGLTRPYKADGADARLRLIAGLRDFVAGRFGERSPISEGFTELVRDLPGVFLGLHLLADADKAAAQAASAAGAKPEAMAGIVRLIALTALGLRGADVVDGFAPPGTDGAAALEAALNKYERFAGAMKACLTPAEAASLNDCVEPLKYQYMG